MKGNLLHINHSKHKAGVNFQMNVLGGYLVYILFSLMIITGCGSSCIANSVQTYPSLAFQQHETRFKEIQNAFEQREKKFLKNEQFQLWSMKKNEEEILKEYDAVNNWRHGVWYNNPFSGESRNEFIVDQDLLASNYFRYVELIAFQYNRTDPTYNSSIIVLNGRKFIALEAPSTESVNRFFKLLHNHNVTHLVRLTPAYEKDIQKSHPYWETRVEVDPQTFETFLNVPSESLDKNNRPYKLYYHAVETWLDNQGFNEKSLLASILEVKKKTKPNSLVGVHCHAGVGRTGTFIAGFLLIDEIDRQIAQGIPLDRLNISIEKIVKQLSMQRFFMVGRSVQYLTLYRLVDLYVTELQEDQKNKAA